MSKMSIRYILIIFLLPMILITSYGGCGSSGSDKNIELVGLITNFLELDQDISVEISEEGNTRATGNVDEDGTFSLKFRSSSGNITLTFIGEDFLLVVSPFGVTEKSTIDLVFSILFDPDMIDIESWTVFQRPIKINGTKTVTLNESEADVIIDGDNDRCIRTEDDSIVFLAVKSITLFDCREGVRTQNESSVTLLADEEISIIAGAENGIRSQNTSIVNIGQAPGASDNTVFVQSLGRDGVDASGASIVTFDPQGDCTIEGARFAVSEEPGATVDTASCTLN